MDEREIILGRNIYKKLMTSNNLFVNLQKYKPSRSNPKENFFTEILAYILENNSDLCKNMLKSLSVVKQDFHNYKISTQVHRGSFGQTDIEILIDDVDLIIVEVKVSSSEGDGQLRKYHELGKTLKEKVSIVYLTQYYEKLDDESKEVLYKHLYWSDIYKFMLDYSEKESLQKGGSKEFLLQQFIGLMKNENMIPYQKITHEKMTLYKNMRENIFILLNMIHNFLEEEFKGSISKKSNFNTSQQYIEKTFKLTKNDLEVQLGILLNQDNECRLYIYKKDFSNKISNKIGELGEGMKSNSYYFWVTFNLNEEFYCNSEEKQLDILTKFFSQKITKLQSIM